jgi:hypothetical protein
MRADRLPYPPYHPGHIAEPPREWRGKSSVLPKKPQLLS